MQTHICLVQTLREPGARKTSIVININFETADAHFTCFAFC